MVEAILNSVAGCVPKDGLGALKAKLEGASALDLKGIGAVRLKNKWVGLFLGSFLPLSMLGADRFYKGDFGFGAVKLAGLVGLMLANTYLAKAYGGYEASEVILAMRVGISLAAWGWIVLDCVLVWRGIKRQNLARLMDYLDSASSRAASS